MCHSPALTADVVLLVSLLTTESLDVALRRPTFQLLALLDRRSRGPPVV